MAHVNKASRIEVPAEAQIHLEMNCASFGLLNMLVAALEASSVGEVIRRALQLHDVFEPMFEGDLSEKDCGATVMNSFTTAKKTLHVRIPMRTKERLDKAKREINGTYSEVVMRSILILAQLIREREALRKEVENDDGVLKDLDEDSHGGSGVRRQLTRRLRYLETFVA